jgi:hypothetical protein
MKAIIHNYNNDLTELLLHLDDFIVYDCSDKLTDEAVNKIKNLSNDNVIFTENIGHSLTNWLDWIISNYDALPSTIAFLKGNILDRHIDPQTFKAVITNQRFTPLFRDPNLIELEGISFLVSPGLLAEVNNSWYANLSKCKYFKNLNEFLHFLFLVDFDPKFVTFAPGGNYIVQDFQISKYPLEFWKTIRQIVSYDFFVSEAWMLERLLHFIFTTETPIQPWLKTEAGGAEELRRILNSGNNLISKTQKNVSRKIPIRMIRRLMRMNVKILKKLGYSNYWPV